MFKKLLSYLSKWTNKKSYFDEFIVGENSTVIAFKNLCSLYAREKHPAYNELKHGQIYQDFNFKNVDDLIWTIEALLKSFKKSGDFPSTDYKKLQTSVVTKSLGSWLVDNENYELDYDVVTEDILKLLSELSEVVIKAGGVSNAMTPYHNRKLSSIRADVLGLFGTLQKMV